MAYQETSRQSYGNKVKNSFQGILWGIVLIIAGTVILWWNEGRAVKASDALKDFQKNYVELSDISKIDPEFEGKAVHATGIATTNDTLRDATFGIAVNAMSLERNVEYYQWAEQSSSESKDKLGGSTETTTTYTYEPEWTDSPVNSAEFKDPDYKGKNFVLRVVDEVYQNARNVKFGAYRLNESMVRSISGEEPAYPELSEAAKAQLLAKITDTTVVVSVIGNQVYIGSDPDNPHIGDVRITFTQVTSPKTISILQKVVGDTFESFIAKNGKSFSKLEMGTVSADNMIEHQKAANKMWLWILRIIGILLVVSGFRGLVNFLSTVFAVVPFVQRIIGAGVNLVATIVGLVWSLIVIALAWVAHRPVLAIVLLVVAAALVFLLLSRSKKKKAGNIAAMLAILLMIGAAGCTGDKNNIQNNGGEEIASAAIGLKGPVKTVKVTEYYGEGIPDITVYQYDENGKLVSQKTEDWDEPECTLIESLSQKDSEGRYTKEVYGSGNDVVYYNLYEYDRDGRVVKAQYFQADGTLGSTTKNRYDADGKLTLSTTDTPYGTSMSSYEYDSEGRMSKYSSSYNGNLNNITTYEYDDQGRQVCSNEEMPSINRFFKTLTSFNNDGEAICNTHIVTDENGTRINSRDTTFTDRNGNVHERSYANYDDGERTYESTFNKNHRITHYEYFEGNSKQPSIIADFKYAADGNTIKEAVWQELLLGQVKDTKTKSWTDKEDTFGNWTLTTYGPSYNFDAKYIEWENFIKEFTTTEREIEYRGQDQGQNYGFEGKAGNAAIKLICTNDHDVLFGELEIDGNQFRTVGVMDEDGSCFFRALTEDGSIPWTLNIPAGKAKVEATLHSGEKEITAALSPTRKDLKTFTFSTEADELVGIYRYEYPDNLGSGELNVYRSGEGWQNINFEICNTGKAPSFNMAKDEFEDFLGDNTDFYRYLWDDDNETSYSYTVRFFDGFAVIIAHEGNPDSFFGLGTSVEAVYAKLPSVG